MRLAGSSQSILHKLWGKHFIHYGDRALRRKRLLFLWRTELCLPRRHFRMRLEKKKILVRSNKMLKVSVCVAINARGLNKLWGHRRAVQIWTSAPPGWILCNLQQHLWSTPLCSHVNLHRHEPWSHDGSTFGNACLKSMFDVHPSTLLITK